MRKYPEENTTYSDGDSMPDLEGGFYRLLEEDAANPTRTSLASEKWREECGAAVGRFCREFSQTPEGNALAGVQVAGGVYGEWHYWGFIGHEPDASVPMLQYFRAWLRNQYTNDSALQKAWDDEEVTFETAMVPDAAVRQHTNDGVFRDPQCEMQVVDYYRCQHECVADNIIFFARTVKENWPRPIVTGAFYGYFFSTFGRDAAGGHLEVGRLLDSADVDYLSGPAPYYPDVGGNGEPYSRRIQAKRTRHHDECAAQYYVSAHTGNGLLVLRLRAEWHGVRARQERHRAWQSRMVGYAGDTARYRSGARLIARTLYSTL
jgi:hypothetical protein